MSSVEGAQSQSGWLLEVFGLQKSFGGVAALTDGRFRLKSGSVHALCGGNGAGKSTFLKIVMGIYQRDAGTVRIRGHDVSFTEPAGALAAGISIIEQELSPIPGMTIAENIFLGREPVNRFGWVDFAAMNRSAKLLLDELGFDIQVSTEMHELTVAQIQLVEIAKALSRDADILIMDEPTSAVGEKEAEHLFAVIRRLKARGKGIIYVSHRLTEVFDIADTYTVLRDGRFVAEGAIADIDRNTLIRHIVGRELTDEFVKANTPQPRTVLRLTNLSRPGKLANIEFDLRAGEILGIYGLMGAGRTEILECLFGLDTDWTGTVEINGKVVKIGSVRDAMKAQLALVTEDRKRSGLIMGASVLQNLSLAILPRLTWLLNIVNRKVEGRLALEAIARFRIKAATEHMSVSTLSGGNQQKVVMGKWHLTLPSVLLLDEPTRGVDVGAKREIYALMSEFAQEGGAIVMVSSEAEEVLGMSDRIIVIRNGRMAGQLDRDDATQAALLNLAT
ncbi:MAG: sugar ABC transporter ATP-binding protein [Ancalomicrobiaceae bacterium]|nr:sugar ABC transporter ATP-binding protein [Ancalomicrobiaceae bacterium]